MKKLVTIITVLALCSCTSSTRNGLAGKWKNENGVIIKIVDGKHFKWGGIEDNREVYGLEGRYERRGDTVNFMIEHSEIDKVNADTRITAEIIGSSLRVNDGVSESLFRKEKE